jgi:hypothetical protein
MAAAADHGKPSRDRKFLCVIKKVCWMLSEPTPLLLLHAQDSRARLGYNCCSLGADRLQGSKNAAV